MTSTRRYLLNFAYMGTPFRGSQRQVKRKRDTFSPDDPDTVQGLLEMGLKFINPQFESCVSMTSRTDSGVHALNTTCHFDLKRPTESSILEPHCVMAGLNKFFLKQEVPIRILNAKFVPDNFHCRDNAISRTYLYRLILGKYEGESLSTLLHFYPIEEFNRAYFHCVNSFDIDVMREAAKMIVGYHDFRTFMGKSTDITRVTRRQIFSIDIFERGKDSSGVSKFSWPRMALNNHSSDTHIVLDVYFKGKGFLYKQVRRTAGTLLSAATGQITLRDIRFMLEVPSKHSWLPNIRTLPGHGLYLCEIEY